MASKEAENYYYEKYPITLSIGEECRYDAITFAFDAGVESEKKQKLHNLKVFISRSANHSS